MSRARRAKTLCDLSATTASSALEILRRRIDEPSMDLFDHFAVGAGEGGAVRGAHFLRERVHAVEHRFDRAVVAADPLVDLRADDGLQLGGFRALLAGGKRDCLRRSPPGRLSRPSGRSPWAAPLGLPDWPDTYLGMASSVFVLDVL